MASKVENGILLCVSLTVKYCIYMYATLLRNRERMLLPAQNTPTPFWRRYACILVLVAHYSECMFTVSHYTRDATALGVLIPYIDPLGKVFACYR